MRNTSLARELFLHYPNGSIFYDAWGGTLSHPNPAPWWNYSNPKAVDFWIKQVGTLDDITGRPPSRT